MMVMAEVATSFEDIRTLHYSKSACRSFNYSCLTSRCIGLLIPLSRRDYLDRLSVGHVLFIALPIAAVCKASRMEILVRSFAINSDAVHFFAPEFAGTSEATIHEE